MCDGQDNDCDGMMDEAVVRSCGPAQATGICKPGVETCNAGAWGSCEGVVLRAAVEDALPGDWHQLWIVEIW
jgi:hypothetical protein